MIILGQAGKLKQMNTKEQPVMWYLEIFIENKDERFPECGNMKM
jgi:hypothetical protein